MSFLSFFKKKSSLSLVFDIREFSISVAIVKLIKGQRPEMVYCQSYQVEESEISNYKQYTSSLIRAIDKAFAQTHKNLLKMGLTEEVGRYFFFLGSPWVVSKSKMIKLVKDKYFSVNNEFLKRILVDQENNSKKEVEKEKTYKGWEVLEEKIIQAKLNGYKVEKIYDRKTKEFEVHLLTSFIVKEINDKIESYIEEKFGSRPEQYSYSQTLSQFTFARDIFSDKNDFIYINIGKMITDMYVVIDDVVHGISSFPFGEDKIIEYISKSMKITKEMVASILRIKCHGKCDDETEKKINMFMQVGMYEWAKNLNEVLQQTSKEKETPSEIMMLANTDLTRTFAEKIGNPNNNHPLKIYGKRPGITLISEGSLNNLIHGAKAFKNQPFIKMNIVFLNKLIKQNNLYV